MVITVYVLLAIVTMVLVVLGSSVRVVTQFERGVVFRFGRVRPQTRGPGLALIAPVADRLRKVNMQIITQPVPAQDGASQKLAQAAEVMAEHPAALQLRLRLRQTVVEVAAEKNSTLVLPFPVELLRFLERSTPTEATRSATTDTVATAEPASPAVGAQTNGADYHGLSDPVASIAEAVAHAVGRRTAHPPAAPERNRRWSA